MSGMVGLYVTTETLDAFKVSEETEKTSYQIREGREEDILKDCRKSRLTKQDCPTTQLSGNTIQQQQS